MLSLIQNEVVVHHGWLTMEEFSDILAVSQMTPGPIAINTATYVGYTAAGGNVLGSAMTTLALILPSVILMSIVSYFYEIQQNEVVQAFQRYQARGCRFDCCCCFDYGYSGKFWITEVI